jgi:hypothetical protein
VDYYPFISFRLISLLPAIQILSKEMQEGVPTQKESTQNKMDEDISQTGWKGAHHRSML